VHTVVAGLVQSFKICSSLDAVGALRRDEYAGVAGALGREASMIPVRVEVDWPDDGRRDVYRYNVCRHRSLTPMLVNSLIYQSAWSHRELPEYHTVRYSVMVDFGKGGQYRSSNLSSADDVRWAASDAVRPIAAMLNTRLGPPPTVEAVDVKITIEKGQRQASILELRLDGQVYRPGETLTGAVVIRKFRRDREKLPISFKLPSDLPEGKYVLTACDSTAALSAAMKEMPQRFDPRTNAELLASLQRIVLPQGSHLYLRLPLPTGGLAIGQKELPNLPPSRAQIIDQAKLLDAKRFTDVLEQSIETQCVLVGSSDASFTVEDRPRETLIRGRSN
jgi:hypothetical protein